MTDWTQYGMAIDDDVELEDHRLHGARADPPCAEIGSTSGRSPVIKLPTSGAIESTCAEIRSPRYSPRRHAASLDAPPRYSPRSHLERLLPGDRRGGARDRVGEPEILEERVVHKLAPRLVGEDAVRHEAAHLSGQVKIIIIIITSY